MSNSVTAVIDFETRSECDLRESGSWRYAIDPTTEILCLAFRLPYWEEGRTALWHPAFPSLDLPDALEDDDVASDVGELWRWIESGQLVEAHNAWFERGIWFNILSLRHGWPDIAHRQWRCSAAKAAAHALPRGLDDATQALKLSMSKDMEGHELMKKVSRPRNPLKAEVQKWENDHGSGVCRVCKGKGTYKRKPCETCGGVGVFPGGAVPPMPTLWHESVELFQRLWTYCRQDVLVEEALSTAVPDLSPAETELYLLDQQINQRGFQLDEGAVSAALELLDVEVGRLNAQLNSLTKGEVQRATQRARLQTWLQKFGVVLDDTRAATITETLARTDIPVFPRRALEILQDLGRSSTSKYERMRQWKCEDGRVRGGLLYHGAATGRWSGSGVQPHNFVRGTLKIKQERLWDLLKTCDPDAIRAEKDDTGKPVRSVMLALANALRGVICAPEDCWIYVADYAAIEARVLLWLADDPHIELFRRGEDIYCTMASEIYNRPITKADPVERQLGKATVLGCGYQMGASRFVDAAAAYGVTITEEFSVQVVQTYRRKFRNVVDTWYAQEDAAIDATVSNRPVTCGKVTWYVEKPGERFLYAELPSGRRLAYPFPKMSQEKRFGKWKQQLSFETISTFTRQWQRQRTYGGMIVENLVQAIARDIMADALLRCEQTGVYRPVLSVHDEVIAEADAGAGSVHEFESILSQAPVWAKDCPIAAEGWTGTRYRK